MGKCLPQAAAVHVAIWNIFYTGINFVRDRLMVFSHRPASMSMFMLTLILETLWLLLYCISREAG